MGHCLEKDIWQRFGRRTPESPHTVHLPSEKKLYVIRALLRQAFLQSTSQTRQIRGALIGRDVLFLDGCLASIADVDQSCRFSIWSSPELVAVEQELNSEDKQPDQERKTQWPAWYPGAEDGAAYGSEDATDNELR